MNYDILRNREYLNPPKPLEHPQITKYWNMSFCIFQIILSWISDLGRKDIFILLRKRDVGQSRSPGLESRHEYHCVKCTSSTLLSACDNGNLTLLVCDSINRQFTISKQPTRTTSPACCIMLIKLLILFKINSPTLPKCQLFFVQSQQVYGATKH
jgi:hypothetical protein